MRHLRHLIPRHFAGELDSKRRRELRAHLRECAGCRAEYDALALVLRCAAEREPSGAEEALWREALMERIAGASLDESPAPTPSRLLAGAQRWLAPALAALVLVGVATLLSRTPPLPEHRPSPELQRRGATNSAAPFVDLELSAVRPADGGRYEARRLNEMDAVPLDAYLQLRYVNHAADIDYLYVTAVDHRVRPMDYYPRPTNHGSISIETTRERRSVGRSIRLGKRHVTGPLLVVGLFSERPLARDEVHGWLRQLLLSGTDPPRSGTMSLGPGVFPVVRRILVTNGGG